MYLTLGFGYGSIALAQILYSDPFTYTLDESGNSIVTNKGSGSDMIMYSGRYLDLVNQAIDIPIHHNLGADTKQAATLGAGWTANGSHSYTGATASSSLSNLSTGTSVPSVLIYFTITAYTSGSVGGKSALGTYTVESTTESLTGVSFVGTVLINSVKQITNPNSHLSYWDINANALVNIDCSTLTPSQKYKLDNIKVNNILATTNAPSGSDIAKINANPNLLGALALNNTIPELDWVLDGTQKYYPCMEGNSAYCINIRQTLGLETTPVAHTTHTSSSGTVSASSSPIVPSWAAFEKSIIGTSKWLTGSGITTGWIKYAFSNMGSVSSLRFYSPLTDAGVNSSARQPRNFTIEVSNDNTNWIIVKTVTDAVQLTTNGWSEFYIINTPLIAKYVRMNISSNWGDTTYLSIQELELNYKIATASEIANYTTTARKKSHNKGIQTTAFTLDAIGVPAAYDASKFNFYSNEYGNSQTNLSTVGNFWLEEVIGSTIYQHKFDGTNLTTYTNNVAGTPTAHTPENANYLVGKGVYPKVTANPLATYTQSVFNLYTDGLYTSYNQSARYTALGGV